MWERINLLQTVRRGQVGGKVQEENKAREVALGSGLEADDERPGSFARALGWYLRGREQPLKGFKLCLHIRVKAEYF